MTDAETIAAIKSQSLALVDSLTDEPKPSYTLDGQSVSWGEYLKHLMSIVDWCDEKLAAADPFEERTQGFT
jgi:hypothetical protein